MEEIDIWRAAYILTQRHANTAEIVAALRMRAMDECGNQTGKAAWLRIMMAIKALRRVCREGGNALQ